MEFAKCSESLYYDLIKIPHGHIPAPMVEFWKWLPIPVVGKRTSKTFYCPNCGCSSFFKANYSCESCREYYEDTEESYKRWNKRYEQRRKREKKRARWKNIEYAILPLLILTGKAGYLRSIRYHARDYMNGRVPNKS